jgi:hypothetical protein
MHCRGAFEMNQENSQLNPADSLVYRLFVWPWGKGPSFGFSQCFN